MSQRTPLTAAQIRTLNDLLTFSDTAARLVSRDRSVYDSDEMLPLAAEAVLHKIGEAVSRLPASLIDAHPEVRWRLMRGMRNLIAREYEVVDPVVIWNTLAEELPKDALAIRAILGAG